MMMKKDDDGLKLACRYSIVTNELGYCGPPKAHSELRRYIDKGDNAEKTKSMLSRFEALYPYLALISEKNDLDAFDYDVVDAYWIGNELLETVNTEDLRTMVVTTFPKRGLPASIAKTLAETIPDGVFPHHSFHVLHVHSITGRVPRENEKDCLVTLKNGYSYHWGQQVERLSRTRARNLKYYTLGNMQALGVKEEEM